MDRRPEARQARYALIASILSLALSAALGLIGEARGLNNSRYAVPGLYVLMVLLLALVATYVLGAYLSDLRRTAQSLEAVEVLRKAIPTLVTFKRREDTLVVHPNGDGVLTWEFELASNPDESISELTFPIYAEVSSENPPPAPITVLLIEVDGRPRGIADAYSLVEERIPKDRTDAPSEIIEYGLLRVPVDLERGRDSCHVRVQIKFASVFRHLFSRDPMFVDIPYLTERLTVSVNSTGYAVRRSPLAPDGNTVVAMSAMMHTVDQAETSFQTSLSRQRGSALVWETDAPKLGYSYKFWFRLEEP
jgi:hypothetical protein